MKKGKTPKTDVAALRRLGIKVSVRHEMGGDLVVLKSGDYRYVGGKTFVFLTTGDKQFMGTSLCVDKNYDRKEGVRYALKNAMESVAIGKQIVPSWREVTEVEWDELAEHLGGECCGDCENCENESLQNCC